MPKKDDDKGSSEEKAKTSHRKSAYKLEVNDEVKTESKGPKAQKTDAKQDAPAKKSAKPKEAKPPKPDAAAEADAASSTEATKKAAVVVDLGDARQEREPGATFFDTKLGRTIRDGFREYVLKNVVPGEQTTGDVDLTVDAAFVKEHGATLLSSIVETVTRTFIPEKVELDVPMKNQESDEDDAEDTEQDDSAAEAAGAAAGSEAKASDMKFAVNVDVFNFVKEMFTPKPKPAKAEAPATPPLREVVAGEEAAEEELDEELEDEDYEDEDYEDGDDEDEEEEDDDDDEEYEDDDFK